MLENIGFIEEEIKKYLGVENYISSYSEEQI